MMQFSSCRGGDFCNSEGTHCSGCGRSHEEIAATKALIQSIARFAGEMEYENFEEFTRFVGDKAVKAIRKARSAPAAGIGLSIGR